MVKAGSASSTSDDTGLVVSEDRGVGLDGNRDWGFGNGGLELSSAVGWDISETGNFEFAARGGFAGLVNSLVWVFGLEGETLVSDVFESAGHKTTTASVVSI